PPASRFPVARITPSIVMSRATSQVSSEAWFRSGLSRFFWKRGRCPKRLKEKARPLLMKRRGGSRRTLVLRNPPQVSFAFSFGLVAGTCDRYLLRSGDIGIPNAQGRRESANGTWPECDTERATRVCWDAGLAGVGFVEVV